MTKQMRSIEIEITEIVYFSVLIWELNKLRSQLLFYVIIIIIIIIIFTINFINSRLFIPVNFVFKSRLLKILSNPFVNVGICGNVTKVVFPDVSFRKVEVSLTICLNLNLSIIPTSKISKWLTNEFNNLAINQSSFSVQNSLDFINRIKDIKLKDSEILVSFDVNSLFLVFQFHRLLNTLKNYC
jgi:hypothetical protein